MKYYTIIFLSLFLLLVSSCGPEEVSVADEVAMSEDSLQEMASQSSPDSLMASAPAPIVEDDKTEETDVPEVSEAQMQKSTMAQAKCCDKPATIKECCCAEILTTYEQNLKDQTFDDLIKLVEEDPFYAACAIKMKDFENEVEQLEIKYEDQ